MGDVQVRYSLSVFCLSVCCLVWLPVCLFLFSVCQSVVLVCLSGYLSVICLFVCRFVCPFVCLCVFYLFVCFCLFVCLFVCLLVCLSGCLPSVSFSLCCSEHLGGTNACSGKRGTCRTGEKGNWLRSWKLGVKSSCWTARSSLVLCHVDPFSVFWWRDNHTLSLSLSFSLSFSLSLFLSLSLSRREEACNHPCCVLLSKSFVAFGSGR
jgi:hypothetical protein